MPRKQGDGTVYESPKGSGRWFAAVPDGHGHYTVRRAASRQKAETKRKELLARRDAKVDIGSGVLSLTSFVAIWWQRAVLGKGLAPKTIEDYHNTIDLYILPDWGTYHLEDFENDVTLILEIHRKLRETYTPAIAQRAIAKLSMLFNAAVRWRMMRFNPVDAARPDIPVYKRKEVVPLTLAQTRRVFFTVATHRLCALYHVALTLGLRPGELFGLQWVDVDWEERTLTIRRQIQEVAGKRQQRDVTKTDAGGRKIPLPSRLYARLVSLWEDRTSIYIFPSDEGTMLTPSVFERHWRGGVTRRYTKKNGEPGEARIVGIRQKAGLPATVTPHHFRHTVSTRLMEQGTPDEIRDAIMGHGKKREARRIYSHATLEAMRRALEDYERVLWTDTREEERTG